MWSCNRLAGARFCLLAAAALLAATPAWALDPRKSISQYSRTIWTQEHGLPQDTIRAIAQTTDGYLWLGTDEGLARFDGYEFTIFNKNSGHLPSNSIAALHADRDGSLWIGTAAGLTRYRDKSFTTYTAKDGLPDDAVTAIADDRNGALWVVAGTSLSRLQNGRFTNFDSARGFPLEAVRLAYQDHSGTLWVAGFGGVARQVGDAFVRVIGPEQMQGDLITAVREDRRGNLWIAGTHGLLKRTSSGALTHYGVDRGLPDQFVRSLWVDRDDNVWAGTNAGLCRLENDRFVSLQTRAGPDRDWVRAIFEDSEGDLWVGMNGGLNRFQDDPFTVYTRVEGAPSDEPTVVYQDHAGRIWIGFHNSGLARFHNGSFTVYDTGSGLPSNEVFSISEDRSGDLLICTREGLSRFRNGRFSNIVVEDPLGRHTVFDAVEDRQGRIWAATPNGLNLLKGSRTRNVIPGSPLLNDAVVVLLEAGDGTLWCGTYGRGLWQVKDGKTRRYTTADGLASDQIRCLYEDPDGTLWIGTYGGGLNALRAGRFYRYTTIEGLPSDNIAHIEDDRQGFLWLATTRGICRLSKQQLNDFDRKRLASLTPDHYGVEDGLPSSQCAPGYPAAALGERTSDGNLWIPTSRGLAVLNPKVKRVAGLAPAVHIVEITQDGRPIRPAAPLRLAPGTARVQFRYTAIHLSAPERVRYEYRLEGLDRNWVQARTRRVINYNSLPHGDYRFRVRAGTEGGPWEETAVAFTLLPQYYERAWFRVLALLALAGAIWSAFRLRVRQLRGRFALVLEERARLAREIHDTLAQGFVGISSQLQAVAMAMPPEAGVARNYLDLARKMAQHSLNEARRSVMDLRSSALENEDLAGALKKAAAQWAAGYPAVVEVDAPSASPALSEETEQHLLRIAQEAVANALKHARASRIAVRLSTGVHWLRLTVEDNGAGFEETSAFSAAEGHFGLLGMRERAERIGGKLNLHSAPGFGTRVEVTLPL